MSRLTLLPSLACSSTKGLWVFNYVPEVGNYQGKNTGIKGRYQVFVRSPNSLLLVGKGFKTYNLVSGKVRKIVGGTYRRPLKQVGPDEFLVVSEGFRMLKVRKDKVLLSEEIKTNYGSEHHLLNSVDLIRKKGEEYVLASTCDGTLFFSLYEEVSTSADGTSHYRLLEHGMAGISLCVVPGPEPRFAFLSQSGVVSLYRVNEQGKGSRILHEAEYELEVEGVVTGSLVPLSPDSLWVELKLRDGTVTTSILLLQGNRLLLAGKGTKAYSQVLPLTDAYFATLEGSTLQLWRREGNKYIKATETQLPAKDLGTFYAIQKPFEELTNFLETLLTCFIPYSLVGLVGEFF